MEVAIRHPLSVTEAAAVLGVSPQRVRALIGSRSLRARRVGGRWLVDGDAVDRRRRGERLQARPLSSRNAWALLAIANGERPSGIDSAAASRLRCRLAARGLAGLAPLLARRARRIALRVHPGERGRLLDDPALVRSGAAAAADLRLGLIAPDAAEGYVASADLDGLVARHGLRPSAEPNVVLRVVDGSWPFPPGARVAPLPVVAVDLLEDDDPRAQAAGRAALQEHGPVEVADLGTGELPRPDLLGAILLKARAVDAADNPAKHRRDLAFLLSLVGDPSAVRAGLSPEERSTLQARAELLDPDHPAYQGIGQREDAASALQLLLRA